MGEVEVVTSSDEPDIVELCQLYWAIDSAGAYLYTVKDLAARFSLTAYQVNQTVRSHSKSYSVDVVCAQCGNGFLVQSRSELANFERSAKSLCSDCLKEREEIRKREAAALIAAQRNYVRNSFPIVDSIQINLGDLDLRKAVTLAALLRDDEDSSDGSITPLSQRAERLAPTVQLQMDLMKSVFDEQLILIHPESELAAFNWDGDTASTFSLNVARYYLAGIGDLPARVSRFRQDFERATSEKNMPPHWVEDSSELWLEVAVSECLSYLVFCLNRHRLDFNPGEQTETTIRKGLQWFSIGQLFNLIWRASRDAAAYKSRERISGKQAANSAVTRLRTSIERAYAEGWSLQQYRRDSRLGVSTVSHLLFTGILRLPDPLAFNPLSEGGANTRKLNWENIDSEQFERLIFNLVSETDDYANVDWLMKTNAPDHGRDIGATRIRRDPLSGFSQERIVVQCKHWLSRSVRDDDVAKEVTSIDHWDNPPVDVLVFATSGKLTADAVSWIERYNARDNRLKIEVWNDAKLEQLLAERPHLILSFELR
ncbi:restriction endonuclease [Saccharopolyspora sp. TS4A08]|uniref:Restriction endonuclease n=1 Tax=Saccharopolyspora ipomoeae TaxID=3042027 RepID=A0ABT6PUL3_9PSEU|nr:restriction endonuclease [Saccharopolyspora sp. TS4A08]MDI2031697.1 restriction endonuclease [Saccharopolyspora sp. TS4A08]